MNLAACRAEDDNQRKTFGFAPSARVQELRKRILAFMETHIYPSEKELSALAFSDKKWTIHPIEEQLKKMAKSEGLWNLWIPVLLSLFTSSCLQLDSSNDGNCSCKVCAYLDSTRYLYIYLMMFRH